MTPQQWGSINYWIRACACAELRDMRDGMSFVKTILGIAGPRAIATYNDCARAVAKIVDRPPRDDEPFAMWCSDRGIPMDGIDNLRRALFISDMRKRAERLR